MVLESVWGPCSTTSPVISWPTTHGLENGISPFMTCRSEWQTPHAANKYNQFNSIQSNPIQYDPKTEWEMSETLGFDEKFVGFGVRDAKVFDGKRFVGLPEHGATHVRRCLTGCR